MKGTKKVIGQLEFVLPVLNKNAPCAVVLCRPAATRGGINGLMVELMEDHIHNHVSSNTKPWEDAADLIDSVRTHLK